MVDVSKAQDGGIIKKILTEGSGDTPSSGNEVKVHYTGRLLDGTVFDSSKDRDELFKFKVGTGQVIKGWDEGIVTMKRGEVAILTCKPDYAYGPAGSPPKIPPNSTLEFEVEMHDFAGEDCSEDGGVMKSVIKEGTGLSNPREGSTVSISWTMKHMDRDLESRSVKFILGDGPGEGVVAGVEKALLKMKKGEIASVKVGFLYAYGQVGDAKLAVPGGADLTYQLTLEDFEQAKYKHEMSNAELLEFVEKAKEMGTQFFKAGIFDLALKKYQLLSEYLEPEDFDDMPDSDDEDKEKEAEKSEEKDPEHEKKSQQLLLAGFSNQALCHLKLMDGMGAFKACESALKLDPKNVKALFRRGQSAEISQEWEDAIGYFKAVVEVDPKNTAALNKIKFCRNKVMSFKQAQKKKYANMFERTNFKEPDPVLTKDDNQTKPDFSDEEEGEEIGSDGEKPQEMEV